jgi:pimeloyl-ACP methyl ester carboxylesterase
MVHGFNWDEKETPGGHIEVWKRLYQAGCNARFVGISWASDTGRTSLWPFGFGPRDTPAIYANDVIGSYIAAKYITDALNAAGLTGTNTTIVGHSLGNMLVSSAIQHQGLDVGNYIMLNPAVPAESYDGRADPDDPDRRNMTHPAWKGAAPDGSEDYPAYVMAAGWADNFNEDDPRYWVSWDGNFSGIFDLTQVWQFYSSGEEVLRQADGEAIAAIDGQDIRRLLFNWLPGGDIPHSTNSVVGSKEYTWVYHEITKGVLPLQESYLLPRHSTAGWLLNEDYFWFDNIGGQQVRVKCPYWGTTNLAASALIENPFFGAHLLNFDIASHKNIDLWRGSWFNPVAWIYQPDGHADPLDHLPHLPFDENDLDHMKKMRVHIKLLAEMTPPLSSPAGGMRLKKFDHDPTNPLLNPNPKYHHGINLMDYRNLNLWQSSDRPGKSKPQRDEQRWLHSDYKDAPYLLTHPLYKQIKGIAQGEQQ